LLIALSSGVIGVVLAFAFLRFVYGGSLPLIPFLTVGWLCSLAWSAYNAKRQAPIIPA